MSGRSPRHRHGSTASALQPDLSVHGSVRSSASNNNSSLRALGSSFPSRVPARSFSHHPSLQAKFDTPDYSSNGVREDTAEIASWALLDSARSNNNNNNNSEPAAPDPASSPGASHRTPSLSLASDADPLVTVRRDSRTSNLPEAIAEEDPAETARSPPLYSSSNPPSNSNLSNMIRGAVLHPHYSPDTPAASSGAPYHDDSSTEATPLLTRISISKLDSNAKVDVEHQDFSDKKRNTFQLVLSTARRRTRKTLHILANPRQWDHRVVFEHGVKQPLRLLPCVFLGVLLNVLDALSYGMILFPLGESIFADTGPDGISMFYVSCIISQLVYSCGGSIFKGAVGSEMIEVVPFFHKMTYAIMAKTGTSRPDVVLATTITAYALSSVLTGVVFFLLGALKLGSLVSFFPRHILIGCIGGVGFFLFVTGIEVSARLDGVVEYNLETLRKLFEFDTVFLWLIPLVLAIALLAIKRFRDHPILVPAFFISIAVVFYIVIAATPSLTLDNMRDRGWIFPSVKSGVPFYHFYSYYQFGAVDWEALLETIPAMLALTFFGILHVPINVPALAIAAGEDDLNLNRELVAHGLSNALSGLAGSIQNYLVYVNSEMFIHNGGNSRLAGILLAAATFGVLIAGPAMIGYVPVMVVGALIYYLGIALLEEAIWDTWGKMNRLEYLTVIAIVLIMGIYDFVYGILAGIIFACLNYVIQTSRKSAIRAAYNGAVVESTVRRHPVQRRFLRQAGKQTYVYKLSGFLFFGSVVQVEKRCRALIEEEAFQEDPIKFLIFDLRHVAGIDYSAAEAFTRIQRILSRREVQMIICSIHQDSDIGRSLRSVGLWQGESVVEFFEDLNTALEFCENEMLKAFYKQRDVLRTGDNSPSSASSLDIPHGTADRGRDLLSASYASPRQRFLKEAATSALQQPLGQHSLHPPKRWASYKQPLPLILQVFHELTTQNEDFWHRALPYFARHHYPHGAILFRPDDDPNGFFLVESGILRADYRLEVGGYHELIVAGTTCGELPFFSNTKRTATVRVESGDEGAACWVLTPAEWARMQRDWPEGAREILTIALRLTKERVDAVTSYVLTAAG